MVRIALLGILLLTVGAAGCGGTEASSDGRATVTFWHSFVSSTIPALEELIARFEAEHPGIRIEAQYIPTGDALAQKLVTAVRSQSAPDVSWIHANYLEDLVRAEAIYPMSHFIDGENGLEPGVLEDIYPALLTYASWRGVLYSMPMEATNLGMVYNRDAFREVGLDPDAPPTTWDELREAARRLILDRNGDGRNERIGFFVPAVPATGPQGPYMVWQFYPFLWQAGGYLVDLEQTQMLFGSEAGVRALSFWKELFDLQNQRNFTNDFLPAFASGQVGMVLDGPWNLPRYPELLSGFDWGVAPLPAGPSGAATVVAGEYLAIFRQSEVPDEAWTFVKWMLQPEVQAFWSMKSGYLPVRHSALDVPEFVAYLDTNRGLAGFVRQMDIARAQRSLDYSPIEIERHLAVALEQATVGGQDPATALARAVERSNALLTAANRD
jgi:multiple sugar transport system substrate-binding protein